MEEDNDSDGVVWNFDNAMGQLIFGMKVDFVRHHKAGDLEKSYWDLFYLISEIESSLDDNSKKEINEEFDKLSKIRKENTSFYNLEDGELCNDCFGSMITLYRKLCSELVTNHFYFRKKKGYTGL
jgi:hypothetical protein